MRINWTIKKRRGNFRSSLNYKIVLEPFEKVLAVNAICIQSLLPKIPSSYQSFCMPLENERDPEWKPASYHYLSVPHFKTGEIREFIRLPFRSSGDYPEVEASFKQLRRDYERIVNQTYGHEPIDIQDELDISPETKTNIAASVTAHKMIGLCADL